MVHVQISRILRGFNICSAVRWTFSFPYLFLTTFGKVSCVTRSTSFDVSVPEALVSGVGNCGNGGGVSEGSGVTVKV